MTAPAAPQLRRLLLLVATCAAMGGCAEGGDGEFIISEVAGDQDCLAAASPIVPEMFAARESFDSVGLFMQTAYRLASVSDTVYLEIYQPDVVRSMLGEPVELSDPLELFRDDEEFDEPPVARGELLLGETCPDFEEAYALRGTVVFHRLDVEDSDIVEGEITDAEIVSVRDEAVVGRISGTWRFEVDQARPIQYYPNDPDKVPAGPVP